MEPSERISFLTPLSNSECIHVRNTDIEYFFSTQLLVDAELLPVNTLQRVSIYSGFSSRHGTHAMGLLQYRSWSPIAIPESAGLNQLSGASTGISSKFPVDRDATRQETMLGTTDIISTTETYQKKTALKPLFVCVTGWFLRMGAFRSTYSLLNNSLMTNDDPQTIYLLKLKYCSYLAASIMVFLQTILRSNKHLTHQTPESTRRGSSDCRGPGCVVH